MKRFAACLLCSVLLFLSACSSSSSPVVISDPAAPPSSESHNAAPQDNKPTSSGKLTGAHAARLLSPHSSMKRKLEISFYFQTTRPPLFKPLN